MKIHKKLFKYRYEKRNIYGNKIINSKVLIIEFI